MARTTAFKVFTHDLRSPIQGGDPVWNGSLPFDLPETEVDRSNSDCGAGWNACREPCDALQIVGMWPNGRPSRMFRLTTHYPVIERGNKLRSATWNIEEELDVPSIIEHWSEVLAPHSLMMAASQINWWNALARPARSVHTVKTSLSIALKTRGLDWQLKQFDSSWDAWAARATGDAWATGAAGAAGAAWAARAARDARAARAARAARDAWAARAARAALLVEFASLQGWIHQPSILLTRGLRSAYRNGLGLAIPVAHNTLGWTMIDE